MNPTSASFPQDVLRAQPIVVHTPRVLLALSGAADRFPDTDEILDGALRYLVERPTEAKLITDLLALGEFAATEKALTSAVLRDGLSLDGLKDLGVRLHQERSRYVRVVRRELETLEFRHRRLERAIDFFGGYIREALAQAAYRVRAEQPTLETLWAMLAEAEQAEIARLESERLERFGEGGDADESETSRLVRRMLEGGAIPEARRVLRGSQDAAVSPWPLIPLRREIPPLDSVARLCEWIRGGRNAPRGFTRRWGVIEGDPDSLALLDAVEPYAVGGPTDESDFKRLVAVLESAFGNPESSAGAPPEVYRGTRSVWTRVRGIEAIGLATETDGLPAVLSLQAPSATGTSGEEDWDSFEVPDADGAPDTSIPWGEGYFLALGADQAPAADRSALRVGWRTLLALVGDPHRRLNFARILGGQVHPDDAYPDTEPIEDLFAAGPLSPLEEAMLAPKGPVLFVGPRGNAAATALARIEATARRREWTIARLDNPEEFTRYTEDLSRWTSDGRDADAWLSGSDHRGILFTLRDLDQNSSSDDDGMLHRTLAFAQMLRDLGHPSIKCVGTAGIDLVARRPGIQWVGVPPLGFEESRAEAARLVSLTAGYADDRALDQLASWSGGHPRFIRFLLHTFRAAVDERNGVWSVTEADARRLIEDKDVRAAAFRMLLEPIAGHSSLLRECLITIWTSVKRSTQQTWDDLPAPLKGSVDRHDVEHGLRCLAAAYLVEYDGTTWRLPDNGIGDLLARRETRSYLEAVREQRS